MLALLVVEDEVPNDVHLHLMEALVASAPLIAEHLFPSEPEAGVDADLHQVLEGMWWRLGARAAAAGWAAGSCCTRCAAGVSLAMQALRARRAPSLGLPAPGSPGG